jgi:hypothetical protein
MDQTIRLERLLREQDLSPGLISSGEDGNEISNVKFITCVRLRIGVRLRLTGISLKMSAVVMLLFRLRDHIMSWPEISPESKSFASNASAVRPANTCRRVTRDACWTLILKMIERSWSEYIFAVTKSRYAYCTDVCRYRGIFFFFSIIYDLWYVDERPRFVGREKKNRRTYAIKRTSRACARLLVRTHNTIYDMRS